MEVTRIISFTTIAFTAACALSLQAQHVASCESVGFLTVVGERRVDLSAHQLNEGDSLTVLADGRFQLRKAQQLSNAKVTTSVFESELNREQLQRLHDILESESIKNLPSPVLPRLPVGVPVFQVFEARISRGSSVQKTGYWDWAGGAVDASPNSMPADVKKAWGDARSKLSPLLEWMHAIERSDRLRPAPEGTPELCTLDSNQ